MRGNGLYKEQPVPLPIVKNDIWKFIMLSKRNPNPIQGLLIYVQELLCGVTQVEQN